MLFDLHPRAGLFLGIEGGNMWRSPVVLLALVAAFPLVAAQNPVPFVNSPLVPAVSVPGGPAFTLTVNGAGFVSGATVQWNGAPLDTTHASATRLTALVPAANLARAGTASVTVVNPGAPAASNAVFFAVTSPAGPPTIFANAPGSPITPGPGLFPEAVVAGDFNGDGKLDLAVAVAAPPGGAGQLAVFLGNGDGTFTAVSSSPALGLSPDQLARFLPQDEDTIEETTSGPFPPPNGLDRAGQGTTAPTPPPDPDLFSGGSVSSGTD